jgi:hypothetical protein
MRARIKKLKRGGWRRRRRENKKNRNGKGRGTER